MKNKLTKIYNIFKQIENMNGSVGWDQIDVFYYFYEEHKNYLACWQLLYGLFSENKTLKPTIFGITLTELRKFSDAKSVIYTFENSEEPILVATFERNGKHQVSGTVKIEDTLLTDEKEVTFVDGMNLDSDSDSDKTYKNWISYLNSNLDEVTQYNIALNLLMVKNNISLEFIKIYLIGVDNLTLNELMDLEYVEDRINTHLEDFEDDTNSGIFNPKTMITEFTDLTDDEAYERVKKELNVNYHDNDDDLKTINSVVEFDLVINEIGKNSNRFFYFDNDGQFPTFKINGETPDTLNDLDEVSQFLDYLYDDCELLGGFHPDDSFDNYIDDLTKKPIFTKEQQELYSKYIDDMFEMDSDGESLFVQAGYEDVYDYCMNYRNDSYIKKEFDFLAYEEDGILSVGIRTQILPEKYPSSINFITDGSGDWFTDIYFEKGENSGKELENIFGLVVKANKDGWVVTGSNGFNETIKLDSENSGIVELSYKEQIDWLNKFIDDWNGIDTNDQFADKKMTKMSADLKAFCYVNGLLLMSADDLLMEISDKNQLLGPINVNGIVYKTKLIRDEDNENKYNLEFYKLEGDAQSELVGDCEFIYDERTSSIDEIIWTLPEYELIIDPEDELFESEDLHEMISNIELK